MNSWNQSIIITLISIFVIFIFSVIVTTLVLVNEVKNSNVNNDLLNYVEVGTWILGILTTLSVLIFLIMNPIWCKYRTFKLNFTTLESSKKHPASV